MANTSIGERSLEIRTLRKVIIRVVPFLMALYFVNYLDRTNLGIAKADISEHLQLTASMFGLASGIFFIGYVLVEVPSNLALERFGARRWLARIAVSWGIVAVAIGFAPNAATLLALRFLLGVAEAGLFPGVIFYLTRWFPGAYRARIVAMFMMASPVAAAIGTPVAAWLIQAGDGVFGLAGWQFMMIGVGLPAIILGVICWFYLTDRPAEAHWLQPDERQWLIDVLAAEEREVASSFDFPLRRALTSPRIWLLAGVFRRRLRAVRAGVLPALDHHGLQADLRRAPVDRAGRPDHRGALHPGRDRDVPLVAARRPKDRARLACCRPNGAGRLGYSDRAVS